MRDVQARCATNHRYRLHGLTVTSDIALPDARVADTGQAQDVLVTCAADVTTCTRRDIALTGDRQLARLFLPEAATFDISQGAHVHITPHTADPEVVRTFLLGSAWAILLHQRGMVPLHGCALAWQGEAWLFVGESGAGKSTLAAALLDAGARLVSDDVIAIPKPYDGLQVRPGLCSMKLVSKSAASVLGVDLGPTYDRGKQRIVPDALVPDQSIALAGVVELVRGDSEAVQLERVIGAQACAVAVRHTFRGAAVPILNIAQFHLAACVTLASNVPFYRLTRPWNLAYLGPTAKGLMGATQNSRYPSLRSAYRI